MSARYQILDRLTTTASVALYRAQSLPDGAAVLVKLLESELSAGPAQAARFRREYELLQALNVPGVVKPLALLEEPGRLRMVLELVAGEPLESILAQRRLDLFAGLRLARRMVQILAGLHAAHLIHQDLRPAHWLVDAEQGQAWLVDLSLATLDVPQTVSASPTLARDWAYLSPEQTGRMNRPVDYRTDFYSLGIVLYRMLTGQLPFQANDALEWAHCHIARVPPPPRELVPELPQPLSDLVMKLLAKGPEDRYQSAHGLEADLDRCLAQWQASGRIDPFSLGTDDVPDRFAIPHRLYGREPETATLLAAFERMAATGEAALVTVSGYSGVGKSSLVNELLGPIVRERGYFMSGKFDQVMRDIPYATLTQAFRELVQQLLAESEARIALWRQQIREAVGVNGHLIVEVLPQVELIIGRQPPVPPLPSAEAQHRFRMVFQRFMAVFCRREHPLALFLDDVQWADAASLQFIEHQLTHPDTQCLLLIAAYRDNEVSAAHPLTATLEAIRNSATAVTDIRLAPPSAAHLNHLVADTLHAPLPACEPLTKLVFERTEGNPFFFTQFLDTLHKEGVLKHDPQERAWHWDLAQIRRRDFADNVADLMAGKLRRLPEPAQEALQLAACLGNKFDLCHLALISGLSEDETGQHLSAAARENLILIANGHGKFLHDRIHQAAYALMPEARRAGVHLHIGRTLLDHLKADEIDSRLFDVASQFNCGAALLTDPEEKARVATLNLRTGRKAKVAAAYASACVYLAAGMALFDEEDWGSRYELLFGLCLERAECEFLRGGLDVAGQLIATLLDKAASKIDRAAAYRQKVQLHVMKAENPQAVDSGLASLRLFGIDFPAHPTWEQVRAEYEQVWHSLGERTIESLIDQPLLADPELQVAMDMLVALMNAASLTDVHLFSLLNFRLVNLSLRYGATEASAYGYVLFGFMLGPSFHRYAEGYRFSKLGCDLADQHGLAAGKAQVYLAAGVNALWTQPIATAIDLERAAFRASVETGAVFDACNSWVGLVGLLLLQGVPLDTVWRESEKGLDFVRQAKYQDDVDVVISQQRFIAAMQGRTASISTFSDAGPDASAFDEAAFEAQLHEGRTAQLVGRYWLLKMQARFLSGDNAAALAARRKTEALLWSLGNLSQLLLDYHYYGALTLAALYETASAAEQQAWREKLAAHRERLCEWAENCSPTFRDKHALVSAEIARLEGRDADAMRLYEQAVQSARDNGFVQYEGLAHEAAAGFYLARGSATAARAHWAEARGCFARWGADGKVRQLDARYPQLRRQPPSAAAADTAVTQLDALSVAKASQAISGRIVLDELIDTLMRIVLENAGAQRGALLLVRGEDLVLAAEAGVAQQAVQVRLRLGEPMPEPDLPAAILHYVRRSRAPLLLADAAEPHPFSADPYLVRRRPKSVLCIPILRQATLVGALYLENTLVTHAFTPERVTVLELLASQAAISLENALLVADLQQENRERQRAEAALQEREARIRRLVESNIIGVCFWDLPGDVTEANDAYLRITGRTRQELLSGEVRSITTGSPKSRAASARAQEELRRTGRCTPYESEVLRPDGHRVPVLIGAALLEGSQTHGVAFMLDLTERRQAEADREARRVAEMANRAKSQFLANMSHELRTPLNGILGYAQILQRDRTLGERQTEGLNVIRQSGEHLLTLINDILDFARIEAGRFELHPNDLPLARFLRGIADIVCIKARQKRLDFLSDLAPDLPYGIRADEGRLRQVLLNLLANAVKFTDHGQVTLCVRLLPPGRLRFEVQDTGIGIGEDQLETVFQPFEQAGDAQRRLGGTGLGLAISREMVRRMGGDLLVESRRGQGSRFWFELEVPLIEDELPAAPPAAVIRGYEGPRRTVLVVDDVGYNRTLVADLLTPLGFETIEAANGREGLTLAQARRPDLILMDSVMPVMGGLEAARRLRQLPALRTVPIIAISAGTAGRDVENCLTAGMDAFLPKPLDADRFLDEIGRLLQLRWIHEPPPAPSADHAAPGPLVAPPPAEMETLHHLAELGSMRDILRHAAHIAALDERYRPFADQLRRLARNYQSQAILHFVEQHREGP